jgi:hypothetical protein
MEVGSGSESEEAISGINLGESGLKFRPFAIIP